MSDSSSLPARSTLATLKPEWAGDDEFIAVTKTTARIGQGPQNDIIFDDDTVSTNHALLEFGDGAWRLTDLDSRNGTYVEGVRLAPRVPTPVPSNAAIAFGAVSAAFRALEDVDPSGMTEEPVGVEHKTEVRRAGFRLPVWLVALVLLLIAILVVIVLTLGGEGSTVSMDMSSGMVLPPLLNLEAA